jgi:hypothetical protein
VSSQPPQWGRYGQGPPPGPQGPYPPAPPPGPGGSPPPRQPGWPPAESGPGWPPTGPGWGPSPGQPGWGSSPGQPGWGPPPLPKAGSERTGPLPLHPMTLGDVMDGAFRLLKANLRTVLLVTAAFVVPVNVVVAFLQRDVLGGQGVLDVLNDPSLAGPTTLSAGQLIGIGLSLLASLLVTPFVGGVLTRVVAASYLGEQLEPGPAIRATLRWFWALLLGFVCVHLLELAGLVACLVGAWVPMTFFLLTTPAIVVEEIGPIQAMSRSASLVRPRFWPTLGIALLAGIMASVLGNILGTPFGLVAQFIGLRNGWPLLALGSIVPALITTPFVAIVSTLLYFDARIRQEGLDLQMMAANLDRGAGPASR